MIWSKEETLPRAELEKLQLASISVNDNKMINKTILETVFLFIA